MSSPDRIGVEIATLAGARCAPTAAANRIALAGHRPGVTLIDYAALAVCPLPEATHVVVLDPPPNPDRAADLCARAATTGSIWPGPATRSSSCAPSRMNGGTSRPLHSSCRPS